MNQKSMSEKAKAEKKVIIAIDKMIDLKDMGFGCDTVARVLELLNSLHGRILN